MNDTKRYEEYLAGNYTLPPEVSLDKENNLFTVMKQSNIVARWVRDETAPNGWRRCSQEELDVLNAANQLTNSLSAGKRPKKKIDEMTVEELQELLLTLKEEVE